MRILPQDLRYAFRTLLRSRGASLATIVILALGIGANTAIFSVVNAVLLRPLPFPHSERLVRIWHVPPAQSFPGTKTFAVSPANFLDWQRQSQAFEKMAIYGYVSLALTGGKEPEALSGARVSGDFFSALGVAPAIGRSFAPEENQPGAGRAVILGHELWTTHFGGSRDIVGKDIRLNDQPYRVVGVMPADFRLPSWAKLWVPLAWDAQEQAVRNNHNYLVVARLKRGATLAGARAEMNAISKRLEQQYPEDDKDWGATVLPLQEDLVADVRPLLWILVGAVGLVLLIACANVANLMLAKSLERRREIAVRSALGASRTRLFQQLLSEALLLSVTGGALGLVMASFVVDRIVAFLTEQLPDIGKVSLDGRVLLFTLAISIVTGLLAGLVPAWRQTRTDSADALRGLGRASSDRGERRTRSALVVSEVALSIVLLIGAGLLIRSLWLLSRVDPGFDARNVVAVTSFLAKPKYGEPSRQVAYFHEALERLRAIPGVESAGGISDLPLTGGGNWPIAIEGRPPLPVAQQPAVSGSIVVGDYFRSLRIPLRRGRLLAPSDDERAPGAAVISESMARRFWPGDDPIGKRLTMFFIPDRTFQVVGIVGDVRSQGLERREPVPEIYVPLDQAPRSAMQMTARSLRPLPGLLREASAALYRVDPNQPLLEAKTMDQILADSLTRQRFAMALLASFAALALALASIGIYSVLAYAVRRRSREIAIRMALGASSENVVRMIVLQGMQPALFGMLLGVAGAIALRRILESLLYDVGVGDPWTLGAVAALLGLVSAAACFLPAYRAARVDPMAALRGD
jgi:putative ABC transport system permease protein